jgi:hypothetical protein
MGWKSDSFKEELKFIKDEKIKEFTKLALEQVDDYFYKVAASSTGRYHPQYALNEGGLLRHTKSAVRIAVELLNLKMFKYNDLEKDLIIASLILHDTKKHGTLENYSEYTVATHPIIASEWLKSNEDLASIIPQEWLNIICDNIAHHMGEFVLDYKTKEKVLEEPQNRMQNTVFLCDYIASRKLYECNFETEVNRK